MKPDLVVVGSFVVGATVRLPRQPKVGESLVADLFHLGDGGKGANLAVAAARQGCHTAIIARVGDDLFAERAFELFRREHIHHEYLLRTPEEQTAVGLVYLMPRGENTIGFYPGANMKLSVQDIEKAKELITGAKVLATQFETPDETIRYALRLASSHGVKTILNPAPARTIPKSIFKFVDVLTPNEGEARVLAGFAPDDVSVTLDAVAARLLELGAKTIIITLGERGCLLVQPHQSFRHFPAYAADVVDTVGAGDAFNGGLAVALSQGKTLEQAVKRAMVTASLSTKMLGAHEGLPDAQVVARHLNMYLDTRGHL
jgi:ribokinase